MFLELLMLGNVPVAQMVERAKLAEANGYDTLWVADERFYREVYSTLAVLAQHTERVHLGTCVTDPFARHPALTAMAIATLDEISGKRAILGIGAGISGFVELGIVRKKPAAAMREAIHVIRALLKGDAVDFHGDVVGFNNGKLSFKPVRAEIPVYVASNGPLGQRMTGGVADGAIMEGCGNVEEVKAFRAVLAEGAKRKGFANVRYADGAAPYAPLLPLVTDRHVDAFTLAGTADEVADHMSELRRAGVDSFLVMPFACDGSTAEQTLVTLGKDVWPGVKGRA